MFEGKKLREKLHAGKVCLGAGVTLSDPCVVELLCGSGVDFLIIDSEHGPLDIMELQAHIMATKGSDVVPIVRVAWNDPVLIKRVLDVGAGGVLVPSVGTADEVKRAIAACMYPPLGIRGFGPRRPSNYDRANTEYIKTANDDVVVWVQVEHIEAVNNIEQIVRVPRLDGIYIGPNDLSGSLGVLGETTHPKVLAAIDRTIAAAREAGLPPGIASSGDPKAAYAWLRKGVQFTCLGGDTGYLVHASQTAVNGVKELLGESQAS